MAVEVPAVDRDRAGLSLGTGGEELLEGLVGMARAFARSAAGSSPAAMRTSISSAIRLAASGLVLSQRPRTMRRLGALRPPPGR